MIFTKCIAVRLAIPHDFLQLIHYSSTATQAPAPLTDFGRVSSVLSTPELSNIVGVTINYARLFYRRDNVGSDGKYDRACKYQISL